MRRKSGIVCVLMCGVMLLFTGCKEEPYELSQEDQAKVADYVAHVVTKYNGSQSEGLVKVELEDLETADETEKDKKKEESPKKQENQETANTQDDMPEVSEPKEETVSLEKALKLEEGIKASFARYDITDSYVEADYFAMSATSGKTYLVVHTSLTTDGEQAVCDMLAKNLSFRVVINGEKEVGAQTSILLNDLSTYQGTLTQGNVQDCVLLFETEKESVENVQTLELKVLDGASASLVKLQ